MSIPLTAFVKVLPADEGWRQDLFPSKGPSMLALRTANHLRHIRALQDIFAPMAASAKEAIDLILRDPVMPERSGPPTEARQTGEDQNG